MRYKNIIQESRIDLSYFTLFFEYLNTKYSNFYLSNYILTFYDNKSLNYIKYKPVDLLVNKLDLNKLPNIFINEYNMNKHKRFLIYPILISFFTDSPHQNAIIIDTKKNEVEIFEPYGNIIEKIKNDNKLKINPETIFDQDVYNKLIKTFSQNLLNKKVKIFPATSFLPNKGLQEIEEKTCKKENYVINTPIGFCTAWTMWFIEMRIKYPDKPRNYFIKKIIKHVNNGETEEYVCLLIRNYSVFLNKLYSDLPFNKRIHFNLQHKYKYYMLILFHKLLIISLGYVLY